MWDEYVKLVQSKKTELDVRTVIQAKRRHRLFIKSGKLIFALLVLFTISINTIPAIAQTMKSIPILKELTELLIFNQGILEAAKYQYLQPLQLTQKQDEFQVTVEYVMVDEYSRVIFYRIESKDGKLFERTPQSMDDTFAIWQVYPRTADVNQSQQEEIKYYNELDWIQYQYARDFTWQLEIKRTDGSILLFSFDIPVRQDQIAKTKHYPIHETVELAETSFVIEQLDIAPTRAQLSVTTLPGSSHVVKKMNYEFISNSKNQEEAIGNSGAWFPIDHQVVSYIQSKYFDLDRYHAIHITGIQVSEVLNEQPYYDVNSNTIQYLNEEFMITSIERSTDHVVISYQLKHPHELLANPLRTVDEDDRGTYESNNEYTLSFKIPQNKEKVMLISEIIKLIPFDKVISLESIR